MKMYEDKPGYSEAYSIRPISTEGWTKEFIAARRDVIIERWYDSAQRLRRTRIRNIGSQHYWSESEQERLDKQVLNGRIKLTKNTYYTHKQ